MRVAGARNITMRRLKHLDQRVELGIAADSVRSEIAANVRRLGLPEGAFSIPVGMAQATGRLDVIEGFQKSLRGGNAPWFELDPVGALRVTDLEVAEQMRREYVTCGAGI